MKASIKVAADAVPTHVGVNRPKSSGPNARERCPHARGGEPAEDRERKAREELSPRTWG